MIPIALPEYPYNLTNVTNVVDFASLLQNVNSLTGGAFGWLTVAAVFIMTFVLTNRFQAGDSFLASSFIGFMVAVLLNMVGVVSGIVVLMLMIMLGLGVGFATVLKK